MATLFLSGCRIEADLLKSFEELFLIVSLRVQFREPLAHDDPCSSLWLIKTRVIAVSAFGAFTIVDSLTSFDIIILK